MRRGPVGCLALLFAGCAASAATTPATPSRPVEIDTISLCAVPVPIAKDTDLVGLPGSAAGPAVQLAMVTPLRLGTDFAGAVAFDAGANPDGLAIRPGATVTLPLPANPTPCYALHLLTAGAGSADARGIAAEGVITYADGAVQAFTLRAGEQVWPVGAGATGRSAVPVSLGTDSGGRSVTASLVTIPLAPPDGRAAPVSVSLRGGDALPLVLLAAGMTVPLEPPPGTRYTTDSLTSFSWSDWLRTPLLPAFPGEQGPVGLAPAGADWTSGHLVWANGTAARFWGVSLVGDAALPPLDVAEPFAVHLAALGFNMVRLHALGADSALANPLRGRPGQPLALPDALDRLDKFSSELARAGVFQYLELGGGHAFTALEGVSQPGDGASLATSFEADWERAELAWAKAVWGRVNPYSGRTYGADAHVALVELENDGGLLSAWADGRLDGLAAFHRDELDRQWAAWLSKRYGSDDAVRAAWAGSVRPGLQRGESLGAGLAREPSSRARSPQWPVQRGADLVQFYGELEARHQAALAAFVRKEIGFQGPLVCDVSTGVPHADAVLGACDVVALHLAWDPPTDGTAFLDASLLRGPGRFLEPLGACQDGKPCVISDLRHAFPNRHGQEAPLLWASLASRQGIDAVVWSEWRQAVPAPTGPLDESDLAGRWGTLVQMPAAAWLYRSGLIEQAGQQFTRWWGPGGLVRDLAEPPGPWLADLVDPVSLVRQRVRTAFTPRPPPAPPERRSWTRVTWSPAAPGAPLTIDTNPGFSLGLDAVVGGGGSFSDELVVEVLGGAPDPAVSMLHFPDGTARLVIVGPTIRAGTVFRSDGCGLAVAGQGPAGLAPVQVRVRFTWPTKPTLTPVVGTIGVPKLKAGKQLGTWILETSSPGWWTVK